MSGQDCERLTLFQGGSRASRTALQESVWDLVTSVIYGRKCGVLLEKLNQDGSWEKTCGDYCQVRMDGFPAESCGTLPSWGMMSAGELRALPQLAPCIDETEWRLLPTPTANLWMGYDFTTAISFGGKKTSVRKSGTRHSQYLNNCEAIAAAYMPGTKNLLSPLLLEKMMGFPEQWTETGALEMP